MRTSLFVAVVGIALTAPLGSGCSGECDDCQDAIDHMASKLGGQNCQPSLMENAVNRIRKDCDSEFANWYIGRMVDLCQAGAEPLAICDAHTVVGGEFTLINDFGEEVDFTYSVDGGDKELVTGIQAGGRENRLIRFQLSGDVVAIEALDAQGTLLATGEAPLLLRSSPSQWEPWQPRTVMLVPGPIPGAPPELIFMNWE